VTRPKKIQIAIKLDPWILAALNVIRDQMPYRCYRTAVIESMLENGISGHGLDKDSAEVKTAMKSRLKTRSE